MIRVRIDGRDFTVPAGTTVAAACARVDEAHGPAGACTRRSVQGGPRHAFCGMGVCGECRVEIDGRPHRLGCQVHCEAGMSIRRDTEGRLPAIPAGDAPQAGVLGDESADVVVVGAGPAGLAAAEAAAREGADVVVLDAAPRAGGNIWRATPEGLAPAVAHRLATLEALGVRLQAATRVAVALPGQRLLLDAPGGPALMAWRRLVIATGARERLLPFPGSTRPGVFGAGGLQALAKGGWPLRGRRVVVAGTGPLLLASAATLRGLGAEVVEVVDEAPAGAMLRLAASLVRHPGPLSTAARLAASLAGVRVRAGWRLVEAGGEGAHGAVDRVTLVDARGRTRTVACELLAAGWGLVPQVELAAALGCATAPVRGEIAVAVDAAQRTSVETVFAAGEPTGIAGVEAALASGALAGRAAARSLARAAAGPARLPEPSAADLRDRRRLARAQGFAEGIARAFPSPLSLADRWRDDTLVCRCEDVPWSSLRPCPDGRSARLSARCGMGHCQGRLCQDALARRGVSPSPDARAGASRPPLAPIPLGHLLPLDGGAAADRPDPSPHATPEETR